MASYLYFSDRYAGETMPSLSVFIYSISVSVTAACMAQARGLSRFSEESHSFGAFPSVRGMLSAARGWKPEKQFPFF